MNDYPRSFYPDVLTLTESLRADHRGLYRIPKSALAFVYEYDDFVFFLADGKNDDPPLFGLNKDDHPETTYQKSYRSIWEYVTEEVEQFEKWRQADGIIPE